MSDQIRCHEHEPHLLSGADRWVKPGRSVTHEYRGAGRAERGTISWEPCRRCGKRYGHRSHGRPHTTCSYCGSVHPSELLAAEFDVVTMEQLVDQTGGPEAAFDRWSEITVSLADMKYGYPHKLYITAGPFDHAKFYTRHLADFPDLIAPFNERFGRPLGIEFAIDDHGLHWNRAAR